MGLFSTKRKTVVGVQTFDLGTDGYESFYRFRRDAMFASAGHTDQFMKAMFRYKQKVKSSYSSKRLEQYGMEFPTTSFSYPINPKIHEAIQVVTNDIGDIVYGIQDLNTIGTDRDRFTVVVNASGLTKNSTISTHPTLTIEDQAIALAVTVEQRAEQLAGTSNVLPLNNITTIYYEGTDSNGRHIFRIGYPSHIFQDERWIGVEFKVGSIDFNQVKTNDYGSYWTGNAYIKINDSYVTFRQERYYYSNNSGPDTWQWKGSDGTLLIEETDSTYHFGVFPVSDSVYLWLSSNQTLADARDDVVEEVTTQYLDDNSYTNHNTEVASYFYPSVKYATAINNIDEEVYEPDFTANPGSIYFDGTIQELTSATTVNTYEYESEPLLNIKSSTKSLAEIDAEEAGLTAEEKEERRLERFYQKKILDSYSINVDTFAEQIANDDIKEMSVGMIYDFEKLGKSQPLLNSLFLALNDVLPNNYTLLPDSVMDDQNFYPCSIDNKINLEVPFGDSNIIVKFVLQRRSYSEPSPSVALDKEYSVRIKAKALEYNDVINQDYAVEVYEDYYGSGSASGKTLLQMYSQIATDRAAYSNPDDVPDGLREAYVKFPTVRSCKHIKEKKYFTLSTKQKPTTMQEALDLFADEDINIEDDYEPLMFNAREIPVSVPNFYFKLEKTFGRLVGTRDTSTIGDGLNVIYKVKRYDLLHNITEEFILSDLYNSFDDGNGHSYVKKFTEDSASGIGFFLPAHKGALDNLKFYDYLEVKDVLLSGVVFSVQTIKIKWYQQAWFSWFLIIVTVVVSVVITVATAGAGVTVSAVLISAVESLAVSVAVTMTIKIIAPILGVDPSDIQLIVAIASLFYGDATTTVDMIGSAADIYIKKKLQDEIDKLKHIKEDIKKFEELSDKLLTQMKNDMSQYSVALWAIVENINNRTLADKTYTPLELEIMSEMRKYTVPFKDIYKEDLEREMYKIVNDDL